MNVALAFTRVLFMILSIFFMTTYMISGPGGYTHANLLTGVGLGALLGFALIGFDLLFKRFNLRSFNIAIVGLFIGYLMGQALVLILSAILDISSASVHLNAQDARSHQNRPLPLWHLSRNIDDPSRLR